MFFLSFDKYRLRLDASIALNDKVHNNVNIHFFLNKHIALVFSFLFFFLFCFLFFVLLSFLF